MLYKLSALSSRFRFDNSNYNYTNTNTNVSSHLCEIRSIDPANSAKNQVNEKSAGTDGKAILFKAKENEKNK
jgi:hypothetical protein